MMTHQQLHLVVKSSLRVQIILKHQPLQGQPHLLHYQIGLQLQHPRLPLPVNAGQKANPVNNPEAQVNRELLNLLMVFPLLLEEQGEVKATKDQTL